MNKIKSLLITMFLLNAFCLLNAQEKKNLSQQFRSLKGTPMSPGNYIVARYTNFAFLAAYNDMEDPSDELLGLEYLEVVVNRGSRNPG